MKVKEETVRVRNTEAKMGQGDVRGGAKKVKSKDV